MEQVIVSSGMLYIPLIKSGDVVLSLPYHHYRTVVTFSCCELHSLCIMQLLIIMQSNNTRVERVFGIITM